MTITGGMNWSEWLGLDPESFVRRLRRRLTRPLGYNDFIALYNALMLACDSRAGHVIELAPQIARLLGKRGRVREVLLFFELTARAQLIAGSVIEAFATLKTLAESDSSPSTRETVLELARGAVENSDEYAASLDHRPAIIREAGKLLAFYGLDDEHGQLQLEAAQLYSRHGAFQSAYRVIADVERDAHDREALPLLAHAYQAALTVSCEEGDSAFAIDAGTKAIEVLEHLEVPPSEMLLSNLGTAYMRSGDSGNGEKYLGRALKLAPTGNAIRPHIMVNLAACLRLAGKAGPARAMIAEARSAHRETRDPEALLELELTAARIHGEAEAGPDVAQALAAASEAFDTVLGVVLRLHHRRGLRERYLPRFESLLRALPDQGRAEDALKPIIACRGNALGDWMALLEWGKAIRRSMDDAAADQLDTVLDGLRGEGAPHLFGYLEKYDDAWGPGNVVGKLWDRLSRIVTRLDNRAGPAMAGAALSAMVATCRQRLAEGHCILAVTHAGEPLLWAFLRDQYWRIPLPSTSREDWNAALTRFGSGQDSRQDFAHALDRQLDSLSAAAAPLMDRIASGGARSARFLQDFGPSPPLTALFMRHPVLQERMRAGEFEVRIVAAIRASDEPEMLTGPVVSVIDQDGDLLLPRHEGLALTRAAGLPPPVLIETAVRQELPELIGDAQVLMVSTHGTPVSHYTDPYFAKLGGGRKHPIGISSLQMHGDRLELRLVLLNACYSGSSSARNFQRRFRTSDAVSFPAFSLLNGRAIACASAWRTSDTAGFLFSSMVGEGLGVGLTAAAAVSSAIAGLPALSRADAVARLMLIEDEVDRRSAIDRLANAPADGPFSHPYLSGALTIHSLL